MKKFFLAIFLLGNSFQLKVENKNALSKISWEIAIPLYMWHNRWTFDDNFLKEYNEIPKGLGLGIFRKKESISYSLNFSFFFDSYNCPETFFGFFGRKYFILGDNVRFLLGFTVGFTQRKNLGNYIPVPVPPLPFFGFEFGRIGLEFLYIPGKKNFGNILTIWLTIRQKNY